MVLYAKNYQTACCVPIFMLCVGEILMNRSIDLMAVCVTHVAEKLNKSPGKVRPRNILPCSGPFPPISKCINHLT